MSGPHTTYGPETQGPDGSWGRWVTIPGCSPMWQRINKPVDFLDREVSITPTPGVLTDAFGRSALECAKQGIQFVPTRAYPSPADYANRLRDWARMFPTERDWAQTSATSSIPTPKRTDAMTGTNAFIVGPYCANSLTSLHPDHITVLGYGSEAMPSAFQFRQEHEDHLANTLGVRPAFFEDRELFQGHRVYLQLGERYYDLEELLAALKAWHAVDHSVAQEAGA